MNLGDIWKEPPAARIVRFLAIGLLGWAWIAYSGAFRHQPQVVFGLICLTAAQFGICFIHECGHAIAALAVRWRVVLFVVRPVGFHITNCNFAIIPSGYNDGAGGWVAAVPRSGAADTKRNWAIIIAAGPVVSLLSALLAIWAAGHWSTWMVGRDLNLTLVVFGFGLQSFATCLLSLLPIAPPNRSDGDLLLALRNPGEFESAWTLGWVVMLLQSHVRLSEIPDWMIAEARTSTALSAALEKHVATIDIGRALDNPQIDVAHARLLIEDFRARYGSDGWLGACDAYLAAIWESDSVRAKTALADCALAGGVPHLTLAAEAAVAARLGDAPLAQAKLREMRKAVKKLSPFRDLTYRDIGLRIEELIGPVGAERSAIQRVAATFRGQSRPALIAAPATNGDPATSSSETAPSHCSAPPA